MVFKFGNFEIPMQWIEKDGYHSKPNQRQDLDPYTDQFGVTQRNALGHTKSYVEIVLIPLTWQEGSELMQGLRENYISYGERDANCIYWNTEDMNYAEGHFYLDPSFQLNVKVFGKSYGKTTLIFTEY